MSDLEFRKIMSSLVEVSNKTKFCKKCGIIVSKNSKKGYCNKCRPRTGENNPFFGKAHTEETKKIIREKSTLNSKGLWENTEYREKVIKGATGKKRSEEFKRTQSINAKKQMEDPEQLKIRSKAMKRTWQEGKIVNVENPHFSRSKKEKDFIQKLQKEHNMPVLEKETIKWTDTNSKKRWFSPDGLIFDKVVIEFNGDYWHANPKMFEKNDKTEKIRKKDKLRREKLNDLGYSVIVVWESAWKREPEYVLKNITTLLDWENLDFGYIEYI